MSFFATVKKIGTIRSKAVANNHQDAEISEQNRFGNSKSAQEKNKNNHMPANNNGRRLRIDKAAANRFIIHAINQLNKENSFDKEKPRTDQNSLTSNLFFIIRFRKYFQSSPFERRRQLLHSSPPSLRRSETTHHYSSSKEKSPSKTRTEA